MSHRHICIIIAYHEIEDTKIFFECIKNADMDFFVIENNSEFSPQFYDYFMQQDLVGYVQFNENIAAHAIEIILKHYYHLFKSYSFITFTDSDLYFYNVQETMDEILLGFTNPNCIISSCQMYQENDYRLRKKNNFALAQPELHRLKSLNKYKTLMATSTEKLHNTTGRTGNYLLTVQRKDLLIIKYCQFLDTSISYTLKSLKLTTPIKERWLHTTKNSAYHLTWDNYYEGNKYFEWKRYSNAYIWKKRPLKPYPYTIHIYKPPEWYSTL